MRKLSALLSLCLIVTPTTAKAWNDRGHMTVAGVAWTNMTARARARASALLRHNPQYGRWTAGTAPQNRDRIFFMRAATWPDSLKSLPECRRLGDPPPCIFDEGYTPADADSDLNIGYADRRLRRYWHFQDLPYAPNGGGEEPFRVNAETQIVRLTATLRNARLDERARSFNLTWLLHIVGDVHQPLHATARFNRDFPRGDNGGNGISVCIPAGTACGARGTRSITLHSFWDGSFDNESSPAQVTTAVNELVRDMRRPGSPLALAVRAVNLNAAPSRWFVESRDLAIRYAYASPVGTDRGPHAINATYEQDAKQVARERIAIAGRRLANLLNRALG